MSGSIQQSSKPWTIRRATMEDIPLMLAWIPDDRPDAEQDKRSLDLSLRSEIEGGTARIGFYDGFAAFFVGCFMFSDGDFYLSPTINPRITQWAEIWFTILQNFFEQENATILKINIDVDESSQLKILKKFQFKKPVDRGLQELILEHARTGETWLDGQIPLRVKKADCINSALYRSMS